MRRLLFGWFLLLAGIACLGQFDAEAQYLSGFPPGTIARPPESSGGSSYTGPLNVVSGATVAYGTRALSTAEAGQKAVNICNIGDAACTDLSTNSSTGVLTLANVGGVSCGPYAIASTGSIYTSASGAVSLALSTSPGLSSGNLFGVAALTGTGILLNLNGAFVATTGTSGTTVNYTTTSGLGTITITGGSVSICTIKSWYDQSGNGHTITQSTVADRAVLAVNAVDSMPCGAFYASSSYSVTGLSSTSMPASVSAVVEAGSASTTNFAWFGSGSNSTWRYQGSGGSAVLYNGSFLTQTGLNNSVPTPYAIQGVMNGASSAIYVNNGTATTGTTGTSDTSFTAIYLGNDPFGTPMAGFVCEAIDWGDLALTSTQAGNLYSNQHTFYGGVF